MNVSKISMAQPFAFQAKTKITAPETLLSKEDKEYFEDLGSTIGKDSDSIEIVISDLTQDEFKPNVRTYTCTYKKNSNNTISKNSLTIPYEQDGELVEKFSPKNYLDRIFSRWNK